MMARGDYKKSDYFSLKAKGEGYPARSVYKLQEIQEKFTIVKPGDKVLDLGSAPGSWTMWLLEAVGEGGLVTSVDLNPLSKVVKQSATLNFIMGDLLEECVRDKVMECAPYDLIVSDAAPLTSGNKLVDTGKSYGIVLTVLWYAKSMLKSGGDLVAKSFQGGESPNLLSQCRGMFEKARTFKPIACRDRSFETYIIGINRKVVV